MIFGLVRASVENTVTVSGDKSVKWMSNYCEGKIIARIGCLQKFLNTLRSHSIHHSEKTIINYEFVLWIIIQIISCNLKKNKNYCKGKNNCQNWLSPTKVPEQSSDWFLSNFHTFRQFNCSKIVMFTFRKRISFFLKLKEKN